MNRHVQIVVVLVLSLITTGALSATRFVSDELRISLRSGAGNQYRIVEVIPTGTRLETLETAGEWTRVRTGGETGWVRSQYLTAQRVAADRLEDAQAQLADARQRVTELENGLGETREELGAARTRAEELAGINQELERKLADAEEGLALSEENARLQAASTELKNRVGELQNEISRLTDRSQREWFVVGAGVLLSGLLTGIIVTRIPWRRRSDRLF